MNKFIIPVAIVLVALGVWQRDAIRGALESRDAVREADDDEFDKEVEDMKSQLNDAESEGSFEFNELETQE